MLERSGLTESDWIDLESGPQGRAHQQFAISSISSTDGDFRPRGSTVIDKRFTVLVRYAHRVNPKQRETTRDAALDNLDLLERYARSDTTASTKNIEIDTWSDSERLTGAREWLIWDITLGVHCLFDLAI
jgi:hypothetical protein